MSNFGSNRAGVYMDPAHGERGSNRMKVDPAEQKPDGQTSASTDPEQKKAKTTKGEKKAKAKNGTEADDQPGQ